MRVTSGPLTRRRFITGSASAAALTTTALTWAGGIAKPYLSRAADRPLITHGLQSGDMGVDSGVVWARSDRPARKQIEIATTDSFKDVRVGAFVDALPDSDFTAKLLLKELPAGQDIFYRIRFQDLASPTIVGEPMVGRFRTAPSDRRSISFCWSGGTVPQNRGPINFVDYPPRTGGIISLSLRQARSALREQSRNFRSRVKQMRTSRNRLRSQSTVMPWGDKPSFALINASIT